MAEARARRNFPGGGPSAPDGNGRGGLQASRLRAASAPQSRRQDDEGLPDDAVLWKLASWLSPGYPIGAFAYSHGLEWAVRTSNVADAETAAAWIADCVAHGAGRSDAILLAHAWRAEAAGNGAALEALAELARALASSAERLLETEALGAAFVNVTGAAWGTAPPTDSPVPSPVAPYPVAPYPVALGGAAARHHMPLRATTLLFLHAFAANLISAAVRLVPLGQIDGQRALASLMPLCRRIADEAAAAPLDAIGGCAFRADIAAMRHETQDVRLFRT